MTISSSPSQVCVHLLPELVDPAELAGKTAVAIDILRATTTIAHALAAGATEVRPYVDLEATRQAAKTLPGKVLLGGERGGVKIEGFDFGNSPAEYVAERVAAARIVFTTTNGAKAIWRCRQAARVYVAAFVNLSATVERLSQQPAVEILCAGTNGEISREDVLMAGALADRLETSSMTLGNDQARLARDAWRAAKAETPQALAETLHETQGGRNLIALGMQADLRRAAAIDRFPQTPVWDAETGIVIGH